MSLSLSPFAKEKILIGSSRWNKQNNKKREVDQEMALEGETKKKKRESENKNRPSHDTPKSGMREKKTKKQRKMGEGDEMSRFGGGLGEPMG